MHMHGRILARSNLCMLATREAMQLIKATASARTSRRMNQAIQFLELHFACALPGYIVTCARLSHFRDSPGTRQEHIHAAVRVKM